MLPSLHVSSDVLLIIGLGSRGGVNSLSLGQHMERRLFPGHLFRWTPTLNWAAFQWAWFS